MSDRAISIDGRAYQIDGRAVARRAIPDSDVYLQDDWGDNNLRDRENSGTTTHNGVEGVYRPEWNTAEGFVDPTVANEQLTIENGEGIDTEINLNLDETVTWELNGVDVSGSSTDSSDQARVALFAEQRTDYNDDNSLHRSYTLFIRRDSSLGIQEIDNSGNFDTILNGENTTGTVDITVTRSPTGDWEAFIDGDSVDTGTDTNHTDPQYTAFTAKDSPSIDFNEIKVS